MGKEVLSQTTILRGADVSRSRVGTSQIFREAAYLLTSLTQAWPVGNHKCLGVLVQLPAQLSWSSRCFLQAGDAGFYEDMHLRDTENKSCAGSVNQTLLPSSPTVFIFELIFASHNINTT